MSVRLPPRVSYTIPLPSRAPLHLGPRCLVMGILNITPDSFAERAAFRDPAEAADAALAMQAAGADIVDIGGESTRPGAAPVAADEEAARVLPVLRALRGALRIPISVDTSKADVARRAIEEGAAIVNDISGLTYDPRLGAVVAAAGAALVLMHMRGRPADMYQHAHYDDLSGAIERELAARVAAARDAGVAKERLIADPGVGFAKRAPDSYGVFGRISELSHALDLPVLVGPSRKSFMREALADRPAVERDWGTAAAVAAAVLAGAHIVRVHAVAEMVQVVSVAEEIRKAWPAV